MKLSNEMKDAINAGLQRGENVFDVIEAVLTAAEEAELAELEAFFGDLSLDRESDFIPAWEEEEPPLTPEEEEELAVGPGNPEEE